MSSESPPPATRRRSSFLRAFLASVLGTGMSRVLGLGRDVALAAFLGAGVASDAFWTAFAIPSVFRRFVADEGLTGAMIPALAQAENDGADAHQLANSIFTALLLANLVLCLAGVLAAEWLVALFAPSWVLDPTKREAYDLAVPLTQLLFPFIAMVSIVSFFEGVLNHRGHFFIPKLAPGLVSAGIIATLVGTASRFEEPAYAAAIGVIVGGLLHVLINVPWVWSRWGPVALGTAFSDPRFRRVFIELSKVIAIGLFAQINIIVLRQVATSLEAGSVTWYQYATRMVDLAQGVVAVAIGSALLPDVSKAVVAEAWEDLRDDLVGAVRLAAFLIFPAAAVCFAFALPLTALLYLRGQYTWEDTRITAWTLQLLPPYLLALAGINIVKRVYYALEDRWTLLKVGGGGVLLTGGLGIALVQPLGISGLALALSLSTSIQLALYVWVLHGRLGPNLGLSRMRGPLGKMALCTVPVVIILFALVPLVDWSTGLGGTNAAVAAGGLIAAAMTYLGTARALRIEELDRVLGRLLRRFGRS